MSGNKILVLLRNSWVLLKFEMKSIEKYVHIIIMRKI